MNPFGEFKATKSFLFILIFMFSFFAISCDQIRTRRADLNPEKFKLESTDELIKEIYTQRNIDTCDGRIGMRSSIAEILGERGDSRAIQPLIDALNSPDEEIILGAGCQSINGTSYDSILEALGKFGPSAQAAIPSILGFFVKEDEYIDHMEWLVNALMEIDPSQAGRIIPYITPCLRRPQIEVVLRAARALKTLNAVDDLPEDLKEIQRRVTKAGLMAPEDYPFLLSKLKEYETAVEKNGPRYSDGALIYLIQRFGPLAKDAVPILKRLVDKYSGALADYPSIANTLIQINTPDAEEIVQTIMCHDRTWKFNVHEELRRINGQGCKNISVSSDGRSYIIKE